MTTEQYTWDKPRIIPTIFTKEQADSAWKEVEKEIKLWLEEEKKNGKTVADYKTLRGFDESVLCKMQYPFCGSAKANIAFNNHSKRVAKIVKKIGIDIH